MRALLIETCTERGFVACMENDRILFEKTLPFGSTQSSLLMPIVGECIKQLDEPAHPLDFIAVGKGPGSYTGIRVGVSVAQALAYSWKVPLIGVSSLYGWIPSQEGKYAVLIDARMGGVYVMVGEWAKGVRTISLDPQICSLIELEIILRDVVNLVTPNQVRLRDKLGEMYPDAQWIWEERAPTPQAFYSALYNKDSERVDIENKRLELMYLRETEAEREKKRRVGIEKESTL